MNENAFARQIFSSTPPRGMGPGLSRVSATFLLAACALLTTSAMSAHAETSFRVRIDEKIQATPATGRLVVYLIKDSADKINTDKVNAADQHNKDPADGPFFENPQPMFGIDVSNLKPGQWFPLDAATLVNAEPNADTNAEPNADQNVATRPRSFPVALNMLPAGTYRVQAVLDVKRETSSWKREVGNLYSEVSTFTIDTDQVNNTDQAKNTDQVTKSDVKFSSTDITLTKSVTAEAIAPTPASGVEYVEIRSDLLSKFRGTDVYLRAGVILPIDYNATREGGYPAIYEVPGFGGDHTDATARVSRRANNVATTPTGVLNRNAFWIILDPEGLNGHHLFANSANNGPVGDALITELIPALEKKFTLINDPQARLLRGHSSGGWSTLWLATQYPQTFGASWSSSPDPVDFHKFQLVNIYDGLDAYIHEDAAIPSYRHKGSVKMTIAQENAMEEVLGPDNTSGQQWDSWFAVFGPRSNAGTPAALWDAATGRINRDIALQYKAYDITDRLIAKPEVYTPIFNERIRLIVGDQDNYYLNEAVELLKANVAEPPPAAAKDIYHGFITIIPGVDHGSIYMTPQLRGIPENMVEHLTRQGYIK